MPDHISQLAFRARFPNLVMTARELPRKAVPFHTLLVSAILRLEPERSYTEPEINAELQGWILQFGRNFKIGHAELRRYLVDEGYLTRDPAGTSYRVQPSGGPFSFDPGLWDLDLVGLVAEVEGERTRRKQAHAPDAGNLSS